MKPSSIENVREMYEDTADSYFEMMEKEIKLPIYQDILGRLHQNISNIPGSLIDTACGSGHMLAMYRSQFDSGRALIGLDISPRMVALSKSLIDENGLFLVGDMRAFPSIDSTSAAAVINFFAIHHLAIDGIRNAMIEWNRVLVQNGNLVLAAWEGNGAIDYGAESDMVAFRYTNRELIEIANQAGFSVTRYDVEPVEGFPMNAVYIECKKSTAT